MIINKQKLKNHSNQMIKNQFKNQSIYELDQFRQYEYVPVGGVINLNPMFETYRICTDIGNNVYAENFFITYEEQWDNNLANLIPIMIKIYDGSVYVNTLLYRKGIEHFRSMNNAMNISLKFLPKMKFEKLFNEIKKTEDEQCYNYIMDYFSKTSNPISDIYNEASTVLENPSNFNYKYLSEYVYSDFINLWESVKSKILPEVYLQEELNTFRPYVGNFNIRGNIIHTCINKPQFCSNLLNKYYVPNISPVNINRIDIEQKLNECKNTVIPMTSIFDDNQLHTVVNLYEVLQIIPFSDIYIKGDVIERYEDKPGIKKMITTDKYIFQNKYPLMNNFKLNYLTLLKSCIEKILMDFQLYIISYELIKTDDEESVLLFHSDKQTYAIYINSILFALTSHNLLSL